MEFITDYLWRKKKTASSAVPFMPTFALHVKDVEYVEFLTEDIIISA